VAGGPGAFVARLCLGLLAPLAFVWRHTFLGLNLRRQDFIVSLCGDKISSCLFVATRFHRVEEVQVGKRAPTWETCSHRISIETASLVDNDLEQFAQRDGIPLCLLRDIAVKRRGGFQEACMMTSGQLSNHYGTI